MSLSLSSTSSSDLEWLVLYMMKVKILSMLYISASPRIWCIYLTNVKVADVKPKGITWNSKCPLYVLKSVKTLDSSVNDTCQYPLSKAKDENIFAPPNWDKN